MAGGSRREIPLQESAPLAPGTPPVEFKSECSAGDGVRHNRRSLRLMTPARPLVVQVFFGPLPARREGCREGMSSHPPGAGF